MGGDKGKLTRKAEGVANRAGEKPGVCSDLEGNEKDFSKRREPKAAGESSKMKNENWPFGLTAWRSRP